MLMDMPTKNPPRLGGGLDNQTSGGYTEYEKGAAGRRLAPSSIT